MGISYQKVKSVAKQMRSRGPELQAVILDTLKTCSSLVGSTLGPGGMSVVIEHQETGMPPIITKDGVTVFRALGFMNSTQHVLMEAARDAAVRTASEAGDGTTTATILAEAFVRRTQEFCNKNPHISPQRVVRTLQKLFETDLVPAIQSLKISPQLGDEEGRKRLGAVARISANGDSDLANAVMECFDIIGDEGNVTITEQVGQSKYLVQKIDGYPIQLGFEDSCGPFYQKFVNDPGTQTSVLEKPTFVLYHGRINDFNAIFQVLGEIANRNGEYLDGHKVNHNVVVVATGFSETVMANLAAGFADQGTLNAYPLLVPMSPVKTGQIDFLLDLAALTGGTIMDPLENPLQNFQMSFLGYGPTVFEATRFRSNIIGNRDELLVLGRVDQIQKQLSDSAVSELEKMLLKERIAKLTSGIAKLVVQGSSHGEIKERRDRAEDAVCAVREAIKHGALPGGGVVLTLLSRLCAGVGKRPTHPALSDYEDFLTDKAGLPRHRDDNAMVANEVAAPALMEPVYRLYTNAGYTASEIDAMVNQLRADLSYDVLERMWVNPIDKGLLDSLPAVREAIRNSISIASLLGTCGGTVVYGRDLELERSEARDTADFIRSANVNESNERS